MTSAETARRRARASLRRFVRPRFIAACLMSALLAGCGNPSAEMNRLRQQFEQLGPDPDRRAVAFVLGLPFAEKQDRSAWLYFDPPPGPTDPTVPHRLIVTRFGPGDRCGSREVMLWRKPTPTQIEVHYEVSWSDPERSTDTDLTTILREKLQELANADPHAHLETQTASYQFRIGDRLLVGMQRWEQGDSRLARLTASTVDGDYPRLTEVIELSCRVRILSAGIEFDRPLLQELR